MIKDLPEVKQEDVLFEGEADEYAQIINAYPICHEDCIEILRVAARLRGIGFDNAKILTRMTHRVSKMKLEFRREIYND